MKLLKPTYRLSLIRFSLFTLLYCVLVFVVGLTISVTGGTGGWIGLLVLIIMFLLYLYYTMVPGPAALVSHPEPQSASHGGWRRLREGAGHIAALIVVVGAFLTTFVSIVAVSSCFASAWSGCSRTEGPLAAERETVQTAMNAMMADNAITTVIPNDNTTKALGVNAWTSLPKGANAASLDAYLRNTTTLFYYCWDRMGNVYAQNKKDGVRAEPKDADEPHPCKRPEPF